MFACGRWAHKIIPMHTLGFCQANRKLRVLKEHLGGRKKSLLVHDGICDGRIWKTVVTCCHILAFKGALMWQRNSTGHTTCAEVVVLKESW